LNVITMIGSLNPRDLSCCCSSMPPIPSIRTDGGLITGQNPVSSEATAKALLERLHAQANPARPLDQPAARAWPDRFLSCKSMKSRRPGLGA
jgi:hypothetical protein